MIYINKSLNKRQKSFCGMYIPSVMKLLNKGGIDPTFCVSYVKKKKKIIMLFREVTKKKGYYIHLCVKAGS